MAKSLYSLWRPRFLGYLFSFQLAIASSDIQMVREPRLTNAASYSAQLRTRYDFFGCERVFFLFFDIHQG